LLAAGNVKLKHHQKPIDIGAYDVSLVLSALALIMK